MLDIIHSGESTVDVTGNGYEAFNQGGTNEGKTVEGFSGTYADHPANTGKKLTDSLACDVWIVILPIKSFDERANLADDCFCLLL